MRISLRELMIVVAVAAAGLAALKFASSGMLPIVQAMTGLLLFGFLVRAVVDRGTRQAFAIGFVLCGLAYLFVIVLSLRSIRISTAGQRPTYVVVEAPVGTFGTVTALNWLHQGFATQEWVNSETGQPDRTVQPTPQEVEAGQMERFELKEEGTQGSGKEVGSAEGNSSETDPISSGRRSVARSESGRGRRSGRGGTQATSRLTQEQFNERMSADSKRQEVLDIVSRSPEGQAVMIGGPSPTSVSRIQFTRRTRPSLSEFQTAGYCLWTLLIGYVGGHFARYLYARRTKRPET